jgi:non-specific serine/threonine protein kinase
MAGYNELRGLRVKYLSADPANPEDGQVWYNSTTGNLRVQGIGAAAWSSGAPTTEDKPFLSGGAGTQTAALVAGGAPPASTVTNEYNGTGWSTGGALNNGGFFRNMGGTQTAGFCFGNQVSSPDFPTAQAETYDGSTWTSITNIPQVTSQSAAFGSSAAGVVFSGRIDNGDNCTNVTSEWDGAAWATGGTYPQTSRTTTSAPGSPATDGIAMGGQLQPPGVKQTQVSSYNGTAWSAETSLPVATGGAGGAGSGSTDAFVFGGNQPPGIVASSQKYDGTSWTTDASMATARNSIGGSGSTSAAIASAGNSPGSDNLTEEYNFGSTTITPAAWSSGGAVPPASMRSGAGAGTSTAGLIAGGYTTGTTTSSYLYDGSSWTATGSLPAARAGNTGCGTQTAAFSIGGTNPTLSAQSSTDTFNGSTWSSAPALPTATAQMSSFGTTAAAVAAGGATVFGPANSTNASYEYNGSSWTAGNNIGTSRNNLTGFGIQTSGVISNGYIPGGGGYSNSTEEYDGTNWTAGSSMLVASSGAASSGATQTNGIIFGGRSAANNGELTTFGYDGTAWSTRPSLANNHYQQILSGASSTDTFAAAGGPSGIGTPDNVTNTEEFTPERVSFNPASNLSVS